MNTKSDYRRLRGRSGLFVRNSLWMGPDHVLRVRGNPFSESYRRYYFAEIQAIGLTELSGAVPFYGYTIAALLLATAAALLYTRHPGWAALCAMPTLAAFYFSWQWPTCACYIKTAISMEKLPSLRHRANAEAAVAILKLEIERVQGTVSQEALQSDIPVPRAAPIVAPKQGVRHTRGITHWILFADMLVSGALSGMVDLLRPVPRFVTVSSEILGIVMLLLIIIAAVQQRRSDLAISVRRMVYGALGWYVANFLTGVGLGIYLLIRLKQATPSVLENDPATRAHAFVSAAIYMVLGSAGLILMWRHYGSVRTPPALAPGNSE